MPNQSPRNYIKKRKEGRRKVLPSFPMDGKFETKEEIINYFSGDKIQCLLCGKWFRRLPSHLKMVHKVESDEYREKYGLPWKHALCGEATSIKLSKIMNKRRKNGFRTDLEATREKSKQSEQRPDQPFFKKIRAENLTSSQRTKYFHEDFQNVLKRMLEQNKALEAVCKDADLPSFSTVYEYSRINDRFRKALDRTYEKLPFPVQAKARKLSGEKFRKEIKRLQKSGLSVPKIARFLGVSENMIRRMK